MTVDAVITGSHVISQNGMVDKNIVIDEGKIVGLTNDIPQCDLKIKADDILDNKRAGSLVVVMPRSQRGCRGFKSPSVHLSFVSRDRVSFLYYIIS